MKIGIVTNTTSSFPLLQFLIANNLKPFLYIGKSRNVTETEKIIAFTKYAALTSVQENNKDDFYAWTKKLQLDLVIVIGYSNKIHLSKMHTPSKGIYNVHFGKLPNHRGPTPLFWQLKNGDETIGMAIHELSSKLDEGNIVWETSIKNEPHYTYTYLQQIFGNLTVNGVAFMFHSLNTLGSIVSRPQQTTNVGYQHSPTFKDVWIQWDLMEAKQVADLIKACCDWNIGALASINDNWEVKIIDADIESETSLNGNPGTILEINQYYFLVKCKGNSILKIYSLTVNHVLVAARHAAVFGLKTGMQFKLTIQQP